MSDLIILRKNQINLLFSLILLGVLLPLGYSFAATSTWTGTNSTDWTDAGNWSAGVPNSTIDAVIPDASTTPNDPGIANGAACSNLTIDANGILNGNGQTISVYGNWTNNGTFNHGNGTVKFTGTTSTAFTPGSSEYYNIEIYKNSSLTSGDTLTISGTFAVSGNLTHTDGRMIGGQMNLTGNYTIGSAASAGGSTAGTVINFNNASNAQSIITSGGVGSSIRIDKAGGTFTISDDINILGWEYVQGTTNGVNTHTLTFSGGGSGNFIPGSLTYYNIVLNKASNLDSYDNLTVGSGTLNITGNFTLTDGELIMNTNNPTVNISGSVSIAGAGNFRATSNTITVNGDWSNSGTFNHGNGTLKFAGNSNATFTVGSSTYNNIEFNKTGGYGSDAVNVSGTANIAGNFTHTCGNTHNGQFNLAGNYIIGANSYGGVKDYNFVPLTVNINGTGSQSITTSGGTGDRVIIDKASGTLTISNNLTVNSWIYTQGTVSGFETYSLILGDDIDGSFTPGSLTYSSLELNKAGGYGWGNLTVSGTATVTGNFTHTAGASKSGQINVAGNYIVGASAEGGVIDYNAVATVVNFNGSGNQSITSSGGTAASIRIDKTSGTLALSNDLALSGWNYVKGTVSGINTHTLTFCNGEDGTFYSSSGFTPGAITYGNVTVNKTNHTNDWDRLSIFGNLSLAGNLTLTEGNIVSTGSIYVPGNVVIGASASFTASSSTITVDGNWTNSGAFNHGNGKLVLAGSGGPTTFTPGSSAYYDVEENRPYGYGNYDDLRVSGTATVSHNLTQTDGDFTGGQFNVAGNYIVGAASNGMPEGEAVNIINLNGTTDQTIVYNAGGTAGYIRIDKTGGTLTVDSDMVVNSWVYNQGTVTGMDTHTLTFGDEGLGYFVPGNLTYQNLVINKGYHYGNYDDVWISGIATVSGNFTQTDGDIIGWEWGSGQINLAGNYIIAAGAGGVSPTDHCSPAVVNFNHVSNNQSITSAGGIGAQIRVDKAGGTLTVANDLIVNGWIYVQGMVAGLDTHTLTLGDDFLGTFTPGALTYSNITINKTFHYGSYDDLTVSAGTLNVTGNLTFTDGDARFNTNNTTINIGGNVSLSGDGVFYTGTNPITVSGNWTNSSNFSQGSGKLILSGNTDTTFTPGSSTYTNIEENKNGDSNNDALTVSGTATVSGNFTQTNGSIKGGQMNVAGNYIVGALSDGAPWYAYATVINLNGTGAQTIVYTAGGIAAHVQIDKTSGTFALNDDVIFSGWSYVKGTVTGFDVHPLIFGDNYDGSFTPGSLTYSSLVLNKNGASNDSSIRVIGTAAVTGNFTHTDGTIYGGQIDLGGNYIIGANAEGCPFWSTASIVNFNHASNDQEIIYTPGGIGAHIRIDKAAGNFTISDNIKINSWTYIRGNVIGIDTHMLIFGDNYDSYFTPGSIVYSDIQLNNNAGDNDDALVVSGNLDMIGTLTITDGELKLSTNNPSINLAGNLSIAAAATFTKGTGTLTFIGTNPSTFTDSSATAQNIGKIALNKTNATESQNKLTLLSDMTCDTFTVDGTSGQSDTLDLGSYTLTLANSGATPTVFTQSGTLAPGNSTVKYTATNSAGNINIAPTTYHDLEIAGNETYALSGTTSISGDITVGATSLLSPGTSTVNLTGSNQSLSGNASFYNLSKTVSSSDTLTFQAGSTTSILSNGTLTLTGNSESNLLSLRSSSEDIQYSINVSSTDTTTSFNYLDVQDSNASGKALAATNSLNSLNNTNWTITSTSPVLTEITPVPTYTSDTAPSYTFNSTKAGTITYAGGCSSVTGSAIVGDNTITFNTLSEGTYATCTLTVTDVLGNSGTLSVSAFSIDTTAPANFTPSSPASGSSVPSSNLTFSWNGALDDSGIDHYELYIDSTLDADNINTTSHTLSHELICGDHAWYVRALDGAGLFTDSSSTPFTVSCGGGFIPPVKPDIKDIRITLSDQGQIILSGIPESVKEIAVSITADFKNVSWESIDNRDSILKPYIGTDKLYLKFRTPKGGVSDTLVWERNGNTISTGITLNEGDIVKTISSPDVYIIKYKGGKQYKRLILSPSVFNSYRHLKWTDIKIISQQQLDKYLTSNLVQVKGDNSIYELFPEGDTGRRKVYQFQTGIPDQVRDDILNSVYEINRVDRESYRLE